MLECWSTSPAERPSFLELKKSFIDADMVSKDTLNMFSLTSSMKSASSIRICLNCSNVKMKT